MTNQIVTISGSIKFKDLIFEVANRLSEEGYIVLLPFPDSRINTAVDKEKIKNELREQHFRRIDISSILYVVNKGGYIGEGTMEEIKYAEARGKHIIYYQGHTNTEHMEMIREMREFADRLKYLANELSFPAITACQNSKAKVITLCGSRKFAAEFYEVTRKLTLRGYAVLTPAIFHFNEVDEVPTFTPEEHDALDRIHRQKIDMADEVYVIAINNYIGDNTREEIEYAERNGKRIRYISDVNDLETMEEE